MPRKKFAKVSKKTKTSKPAAASLNVSAQLEKMEKEFRASPAKLVAQCRKSLALLAKQANTLNNELKKAQKNKNAAKNKHAITSILAKIDQVKKLYQALSSKQAKFIALDKQLAIFDKQWEKTKKATKSSTKARKKIAKVKKEPAIIPVPAVYDTPVQNAVTAPVVTQTSEETEFTSQ